MLGAMALAFEVLLMIAVLLIIVAVLAGRRQSIGVLRALGAPARFVVATVWLEGAALISLGLASGAVLGALLVRVIGGLVSLRTGLALDATLGTPEAVLIATLLAGGSLLAALPSLPLLWLRVSGLLRT
jgi:putative ABC transport system permease protein